MTLWPPACLGATASRSRRRAARAELRRGERMNLRAMTTIAQLIVAVASEVAVFAFFIVFGVLVVGLETAQSWSTVKPDIWWQATIAGHQYVLTSAHVRVSGFLGVFSAFYFVVSASTDTALRATLTETPAITCRPAWPSAPSTDTWTDGTYVGEPPSVRGHIALDLLDIPGVAVRVLEVDEPAPRLIVDLADLDAAAGQVGMRGVGVGDDKLQTLE